MRIKAVLRKDNCLVAIGERERPAEITDNSILTKAWDDMHPMPPLVKIKE